MKNIKQLSILFVLALSCILLTSCEDIKKKNLIGAWGMSEIVCYEYDSRDDIVDMSSQSFYPIETKFVFEPSDLESLFSYGVYVKQDGIWHKTRTESAFMSENRLTLNFGTPEELEFIIEELDDSYMVLSKILYEDGVKLKISYTYKRLPY